MLFTWLWAGFYWVVINNFKLQKSNSILLKLTCIRLLVPHGLITGKPWLIHDLIGILSRFNRHFGYYAPHNHLSLMSFFLDLHNLYSHLHIWNALHVSREIFIKWVAHAFYTCGPHFLDFFIFWTLTKDISSIIEVPMNV